MLTQDNERTDFFSFGKCATYKTGYASASGPILILQQAATGPSTPPEKPKQPVPQEEPINPPMPEKPRQPVPQEEPRRPGAPEHPKQPIPPEHPK